MQFEIVLWTSISLIVVLAVLVWLKTREPAFVLGSALIYYWTLHGAWSIVRERSLGTEESFTYLYYKMFSVFLDEQYLLSLVLYATFIIVVQVTVLVLARGYRQTATAGPAVEISHFVLLLGCTMAAGASFLVIKDSLAVVSSMNLSAYGAVAQITPLWNLYSVLNGAALAPLAIGLTVYLAGDGGIYMRGSRNGLLLIWYFALIGWLLYLNMRLGNRGALLFVLLSAGLFYVANVRRLRLMPVLLAGVAGSMAVILPGLIRDEYKMKDMQQRGIATAVIDSVREAGSSIEAVSAHLSMYGSIEKHVPLIYGASLVSLAASAIPRLVFPSRPPSVYEHYARSVRAQEGQGYTVHHATGWYLNFGAPGVVMGGIALGAVWAFVYNRFRDALSMRCHFRKVFWLMGIWLMTGFLPILLRDGPEAYKGLIVEGLVLPVLVIAPATVTAVLRNGRPDLAPLRRFETGR